MIEASASTAAEGVRAEVEIVAKIRRERRLRVLEGGVSATTSVPHLAFGDRASALALAEKAIDIPEGGAGLGRSGSETAVRGEWNAVQ
jgi:hypothetical protein